MPGVYRVHHHNDTITSQNTRLVVNGWKHTASTNTGGQCVCGLFDKNKEKECRAQMKGYIRDGDDKRCVLITIDKRKKCDASNLVREQIFDVFGIGQDKQENIKGINIRPIHFNPMLLQSNNRGPLSPKMLATLKSDERMIIGNQICVIDGECHPLPTKEHQLQPGVMHSQSSHDPGESLKGMKLFKRISSHRDMNHEIELRRNPSNESDVSSLSPSNHVSEVETDSSSGSNNEKQSSGPSAYENLSPLTVHEKRQLTEFLSMCQGAHGLQSIAKNGPTVLLKKDLDTLYSQRNMSSDMLNYYINLLNIEEIKNGRCHWVYDTYFWKTLVENGFVKSWGEQAKNIFGLDKLVIPIQIGRYFSVIVIFIQQRFIYYYDPLKRNGSYFQQMIVSYLENEWNRLKQCGLPFGNFDVWKYGSNFSLNWQKESLPVCDTGIFCSFFIGQILRNSIRAYHLDAALIHKYGREVIAHSVMITDEFRRKHTREVYQSRNAIKRHRKDIDKNIARNFEVLED